MAFDRKNLAAKILDLSMLSRNVVATQERADDLSVSVVIPTYQREKVLLDTVDYLLCLDIRPAEILLVDQTREHEGKRGRDRFNFSLSLKLAPRAILKEQ